MDKRPRQILILGLGNSGFAAAETALAQGAAVTVLDGCGTALLAERRELLVARGATVHLDYTDATWTRPCELAVISPGIAPASPLGKLAAALSCPVISELEFGYRFCACPILAVSGTNGKTTTVELLVHCLNHAGYRVLAAGNIGRPLCEAARKSAALDYLICEVSSFQLQHTDSFAPLAAAILNITPDHLDWHGSFEAYRDCKLKLLHKVAAPRYAVLRQDLLGEPSIRGRFPAVVDAPLTFSATDPAATFFLDAAGGLCQRLANGHCRTLLARTDLKLSGHHNVENVLAAFALAAAAGIDLLPLAAHVRTFAPNAHRMELVAYHHGVRYINDSKATNADALRQALLTAMEKRDKAGILLIAGGIDKGLSFIDLKPLLRDAVKDVFLIGSSRQRLAKQWGDVVSCKMFASLEAAFEAAADSAAEGDVVMLSPGCASQDMFENYAQRGHAFCALVKRRIGE